MATFQLFFSVQGTGGGPTGPDTENRVGDQDVGNPGRPVSSRLQVSGEQEHCRALMVCTFYYQNILFASFAVLKTNKFQLTRRTVKRLDAV